MKTESGTGWTMFHGSCLDVMRELDMVDVTMTDPPYSEHVHSKSRRGASLPDTAKFSCRFNRAHDFGFSAISAPEMSEAAARFASLTRRWTLVFSNIEIACGWRARLKRCELDYVRTGAWWKLRATPQFTGDRPAAGFEAITICHPKGRKKWNGGGKQGGWAFEECEGDPVYRVPVVQNDTADRSARFHTAQKPLALMLALVDDFTNPGETVLDAYAGVATTGVACLRRGRRFVGIEKDEEYFRLACERLAAEEQGISLGASLSGQTALFGGDR